MVSRSIVSALLLSMAPLAAVSTTTPLRAALGLTVADAAQMVASEKTSVDAEIRSLQAHAAELEVGSAASQVEANAVRGQIDAYLKSSEVQLLKSNVDAYNASCTNRMLIGNQSFTCGIAHEKLQKLATRHNQTMTEFRHRLVEQNIRTRQIENEILLTRDKIQDLQNYAPWLELAREKIATACGGLSASATSREEIEPRCGHVPFDRVRVDLPPCEGQRCRTWGQP